jgi:DNA-binding NarL/FixJ family response regulator
VRKPLPDSVRAAAGPAFENARAAVQRAKATSPHLAVVGPDRGRSGDAEVLLSLLAEIVQRRTAQGWEVVDLLADGRTQKDVAAQLGISAQAVSQRARVAMWQHEQDARPLAARLLTEADA